MVVKIPAKKGAHENAVKRLAEARPQSTLMSVVFKRKKVNPSV